jgi:hypothetical protein
VCRLPFHQRGAASSANEQTADARRARRVIRMAGY